MQYHEAKPIWRGRTVACIACGPSLTQEDCEAIRKAGLPTIAINNAGIDYAPWADVLYACDAKWWERYPAAQKHKGLKVAIDRHPLPTGVLRMRNGGQFGFDGRPDTLRTGKNSGYQALHLSVHMGAARVILLGYDMTGTDTQPHYFGRHEQLNNPQASHYSQWRDAFATLAPELERMGVEVINCTRETALECFPREAVEDVLCPA